MYITLISRSTYPRAPQHLHGMHAKRGTEQAAEQAIGPHLEVDVLNRKWAATPEAEVATIALVSEAAATIGGMPIIMSIGVVRKPPPTPKRPDKKPITKPTETSRPMLIEMPAIGRKTGRANETAAKYGHIKTRWLTTAVPGKRLGLSIGPSSKCDT